MEICRAVCACIQEVTGRAVEPSNAATAAAPIIKLWTATGRPPLGEFEADFKLVARAARECPAPLFARDVRGDGWEGGVDRHRDVATIAVQKRWDARLDLARRWEAGEDVVRDRKRSARSPHEAAPYEAPEYTGPLIDVGARLKALAKRLPERLATWTPKLFRLQAMGAEDAERELAKLDRAMLKEAAGWLEPEQREEMATQVAAAMAKLGDRLDDKARKTTTRRLKANLLRERLGLPELSLFGTEVGT